MNRNIVALAIAAMCSFTISSTGVQARWFHHDSQTHASQTKDPRWHDVPTGFALAKTTHKPIITDVYTDWCGWCKRMAKTTFEDPGVEKLMADNFVLVRANAEDGGPGQQLAQQYGINGYPTILFFDSDGQMKSKIVGFKDADGFTRIINSYLQGTPISEEP